MTPLLTAWRQLDAYLGSLGIRYGAPTVGQTTGGVHVPTSLHYEGRARDYGRSNSDLIGILEALLPLALGPNQLLAELYGLTVFVKGGRIIRPSAGLRASHQSHVHAALEAGVILPMPQRPEVPVIVPNNPDLNDIAGPVELHLVVNVQGDCTGYYFFSPSTGELHGYGPGAQYYGRSEVVTR